MNGEMEEIKQAVERYKKETKLKKAELLGIKFVTSERGADLLNELSRVFDLVDVKQKDSKAELQNAESRIWNTVETKDLTFIDGVLVTWEIFDRILKNRLTNENGDPEKDNTGHDYLGIINDDINDLILSEVLEQGYLKIHGEHLHELFDIKSSAYKRPAWMRNKN